MIYFLTYNKLPNGDASAVRNINIARNFVACGYKTKLVGMGMTEIFQQKEYEDVSYLSLRINKYGLYTKLKNYFGYKSRLKKILEEEKNIEAFVVNSLPINALIYIKNISKQKGIKLFVDCCEWYSPEQFRWGILDINYIMNMFFVQKYIDKSTYPIAISKYLEKYFRGKSYNIVRIPVLMDIRNMSYKKQTNPEKLTLLYAGSPGKKDYLKEIIEGIALLEKQTIDKIDFRIIGVNTKQLIELCSIRKESIDRIGNSLRAEDRVPREFVLKNLEEADFTVLMRSPTQRYAEAGFPTKVVESLASGTPVICNITSDLGDYIHDGENGIIVQECSGEAFSIAIKKALDLTFEQRKIMYENARRCAEENFDYRLYKETLQELIKAY